MEIPKEYHYTYYSYEEWGMGYFGSRTCKCSPEEDVNYFGSFADKTFNPTQKIILKSDYNTREDADADEVILHEYFEVDINLHFANRARQTSTKFRLPREKAIEIGRKNGKEHGKKGGQKTYELGIGFHGIRKEQRIEFSKKGGNKNKELGIGICGLTYEQRVDNGKKGGKNASSQKWMCTETGFITNAGSLSQYQRAKCIDTSKRKRIE